MTTAILTSGGRTVTNQRIEAAQGSKVIIVCRGGSNPTWKKGTGSTATGLPTGVSQIRNSIISIVNIYSLTLAKTGVYACHYGVHTIETVTVGEFTLSIIIMILLLLFNLMYMYMLKWYMHIHHPGIVYHKFYNTHEYACGTCPR